MPGCHHPKRHEKVDYLSKSGNPPLQSKLHLVLRAATMLRRIRAAASTPIADASSRIRRTRRPHHENDDDDDSVGTTLTVETKRAKHNENQKPISLGRTSSTQVYVHQTDPVPVLEEAQSDITTLSIYMKEVSVNPRISKAFLALIRGDNRSWEAIAVDILRQKARWESIALDDCSGNELDLLLSFIWAVDNCAFVHLSNLSFSPHASWSLQSMVFSKSLTKIQLDLIDLTPAMTYLCKGLRDNTSITCLIASRCGLNDTSLQVLVENLPRRLEELRLFGNKCRSKGLSALAALLQHSTFLKILDLSYQHVQPGEDFDIAWMASILTNNKHLKVLDLDNDAIDDGHLTHLCAMLCRNTTLEELMLNHNSITATGIALLASKFGDMKGLKKISMYSNQFDAGGNTSGASPGKHSQPTQAAANGSTSSLK